MSGAVVVVGAGLGGARVAAGLRSAGYDGELILVGKESHIPYDRPPLSKGVLTSEAGPPELHPEVFYRENKVDLRTGTQVTAVDPSARTVTLESAGGTETLDYGTLVLATGLNARSLPFAAGKAGVHTLRTYDDAAALRSEIDGASTAVVVGAGFIGCEVAASLRTRGLAVTVVEPAGAPLALALGERVGSMVGRILVDRGIEIRTGVGVSDLLGEDTVSGVRTTDGAELPADIVVLGIGSVPVVDYLHGSSIALAAREDGGGIACDEVGRTSDPNVYALGDVANWRRPGGTSRVEHWNSVVDQAATVARAVLDLDDSGARATVPYFWSDQFDIKIQALGHPSPNDDVHVASDDGSKFLVYYSRDGVLTGVVGAGKAGAVMKLRSKLHEPTPIASLLD